jgi:hypothetical protein
MNRSFIAISRRISSPSIKEDLLNLCDQYIRNCGEKVPFLPEKVVLEGFSNDELMQLLRNQSKNLIRVADNSPAYPCAECLKDLLMKYGIR